MKKKLTYEPIVFVFYIDRETMKNPDIMGHYINSVKRSFDGLEEKVRCFFFPTDTEERLECINPRHIKDEKEWKKLTDMLKKTEKLFDIERKNI